MSLPIIGADQRLQEQRGIKGCIFGQSGIGKTSLLWTLPTESTLFMDLEAGDLAIEGWQGDTLRPKTWNTCRDLAVFLGGPNPSMPSDHAYSKAHYEAVCQKYGDPKQLDRYKTLFIDSITVAGRLCLAWCKNQPQCLSEKTGKPDTRKAYGLHGQEMIGWLSYLQHIRTKNIWFVGILETRMNDNNQLMYEPQIDGSKTGLELPGIVDQVITLAQLKDPQGQDSQAQKPYRAFVCQTLNPYGYPAKDRSGRLELIEKPHLGELMTKITGPVKPIEQRLSHGMPSSNAPSHVTESMTTHSAGGPA